MNELFRIDCATLQKGSPHWSLSPFALIGDAPRELLAEIERLL